MKHFIIFLSITYCTTAFAQDGLNLKQCIDYALDHHPSMQVADNNTGIARAQSTQSLATYLPQVNGLATMLDNIKLQTTLLPAGIIGPEPTAIQFGTKYSVVAAVDVTQTIFDASKIVGIKANKPYAEFTLLQKEQNKETLIYNTAIAYFQVLIYREQLNILTTNKHKYEQMVQLLQYQHEKGTVLEKDVDRVKVNLNTTYYQIQDATTKAQNAVATLKNTIGMPLEKPITVADSMDYTTFATDITNDSLVIDALTEVKLNEKSVELQRYNLKTKQMSYLPSLNAVGKLGTQALNNEFSDVFSNWRNFSYVGLSLNVPLFSGFKRKGQEKEEKLKLKNEELNLTINKENLKLRHDNAKTSVSTAYSSYQSNRDNMALAQKLLNVTDYQYQRGVATLTDYLNDDTAYKTAQSNYINSLYNLMISQLNYEKSQGTLVNFTDRIK